MSATSKPETDPITTHVLDQTSGRPGVGIRARLALYDYVSHQEGNSRHGLPLVPKYWYADTAHRSGRVSRWHHIANDPNTADEISTGELHMHDDGLRIQDVFDELRKAGINRSIWVIMLDTEKYWLGHKTATFYPFVQVHFRVDLEEGRDHWHVPFLLGPHGYTTYRGT